MGRAIEVPVTPSVIRWAINESGYSVDEIARSLGVDSTLLNDWGSGESKPTLTQARKLAAKLHRPFAALLLPAAPVNRPLPVEFRHSASQRRALNPSERRYLRRAARYQDVLGWLVKELALEMPQTLHASVNDDPVKVAAQARRALGVSTQSQKKWPTPSTAFDEWRTSLEDTGHLVFLFSLGADSSQGFSLWNDFAPIVAVNSAWNESARIFTLLHEFGHLVTRTSSACLEPRSTSSRTDPIERWCERFAAAVLMPIGDVEETLRQKGWRSGTKITNLPIAKSIATLYKVSLRAAVIRIIELGAADWTLYDQIPPISDSKPKGGGGTGRNRTEIREDQLGNRVSSLLVAAVEHDLLSRSQAVDFLDIPEAAFDSLADVGSSVDRA